MRSPTKTFWLSGIFGIGTVASLVQFGWLDWMPFVGDLLRRGGAAELIATAVLGTTVWVLLTLLAISRQVGREHRLTRLAMFSDQRSDEASLFNLPELAGTRLQRRYLAFHGRGGAGDRDLVGFLLAARSAVDEARSENPYGPIRALVWALPALGFLGTAAEMSSSIGGVGAAVARTSTYGDLRDFLAQNVIPPLANAFGLTLFALACSVMCHVLVSITYARERRLAIDVDDWALDRLAVTMPPSPGGQVINLHGNIDRLATEVAELRAAMSDATSRLDNSAAGAIGVLWRMSEQLDRELVIRPVSQRPSDR